MNGYSAKDENISSYKQIDVALEDVSPEFLGSMIFDIISRSNPETVKYLGIVLGYEYGERRPGTEDIGEILNDATLSHAIKDHLISIMGYFFLWNAKDNSEYRGYIESGNISIYANLMAQLITKMQPKDLRVIVARACKLIETHFDNLKKKHNQLIESQQASLLKVLDSKVSINSLPKKTSLLNQISDNDKFSRRLLCMAPSFDMTRILDQSTLTTNMNILENISFIDKNFQIWSKIEHLLEKNIPQYAEKRYERDCIYSEEDGKFIEVVKGHKLSEPYKYDLDEKVLYHIYRRGKDNIGHEIHNIVTGLEELFEKVEDISYNKDSIPGFVGEIERGTIQEVQKALDGLKQRFSEDKEMLSLILMTERMIKDRDFKIMKQKAEIKEQADSKEDKTKKNLTMEEENEYQTDVPKCYMLKYESPQELSLIIEAGRISFVREKNISGISIPIKQLEVIITPNETIFSEKSPRNISMLATHIKSLLKTHADKEVLEKMKLTNSWVSLGVVALLELFVNRQKRGKKEIDIYMQLLNEFPWENRTALPKQRIPNLKIENIIAYIDEKKGVSLNIDPYFSNIESSRLSKELQTKDISKVNVSKEELLLLGGRNSLKSDMINRAIKEPEYFIKKILPIHEKSTDRVLDVKKTESYLSFFGSPNNRISWITSAHYATNVYQGFTKEDKERYAEEYNIPKRDIVSDKATDKTNERHQEYIDFIKTMQNQINSSVFDKDFFWNTIGFHSYYFSTITKKLDAQHIILDAKYREYLNKMIEELSKFPFDILEIPEKGETNIYKKVQVENKYTLNRLKIAKVEELDKKLYPGPVNDLMNKRAGLKEAEQALTKKKNQIFAQRIQLEKEFEGIYNDIERRNKEYRGLKTRYKTLETKIKNITNNDPIPATSALNLKQGDTFEILTKEIEHLKKQAAIPNYKIKIATDRKNKTKSKLDFYSREPNNSHTSPEKIERIQRQFKEEMENVQHLRDLLKPIQIQIAKRKSALRCFPKEYKEFLMQELKELDLQIQDSPKQALERFEIKKEDFDGILDFIHNYEDLDLALTRKTTQINTINQEIVTFLRDAGIMYKSLTSVPKSSKEKLPLNNMGDDGIESLLRITKDDILSRVIMLFITENMVKYPEIYNHFGRLLETTPDTILKMTEKFMSLGLFPRFFGRLYKNDERLAKALFMVWTDNLDMSLDKLFDHRDIDSKIQIDEKYCVVYDKMRKEFIAFINILHITGILSDLEMKTNRHDGIYPESFKEWFGEDKELYEGIIYFLDHVSHIAYNQVKKEYISETYT